jgi:hypothetical protein
MHSSLNCRHLAIVLESKPAIELCLFDSIRKAPPLWLKDLCK